MERKKKIAVIVGTRPNFIKVTRFREVAGNYPQFEISIIHTGQHFDGKMANVFFEQFNLVPDRFLEVPPASPITQLAGIMVGLEKAFQSFQPDLVVVVGDVNSTMAASITANKMNIRLAHVESGLRSFDPDMPEEWNRLVTDLMADIYFVSEPSGEQHLLSEGKDPKKIFFVGNTMIDTMVAFEKQIHDSNICNELGIGNDPFVLMTMHRPSNVDSEPGLKKLYLLIRTLTEKYHVIFPVHPRTIGRMKETGMYDRFLRLDKLKMIEPLDYFAFQKLIKSCRFILTDSGGIQEESTFLRVPCLTLRENTERPVTVTEGTNELVPFDPPVVIARVQEIENGAYKKGHIPEKWDGKATERIFEILNRVL